MKTKSCSFRIAIISTHPVQYNAPLFKKLAQQPNLQIKVFYTWSQRQHNFLDQTFGKEIKWDIPLLEGYDYEFIPNTSKKPGSHHNKGIINPGLIKKNEEWQPSHILVYGWNFHSHISAMRYFKGKIPVLFRGDSTLLDHKYKTPKNIFTSSYSRFFNSSIPQFLKYKLRRFYLKKIYKNTDLALYTGINNKQYFLEHGLKENQLVFAPHAIENERFFDNSRKEYEKKAFQWRKELGYKEDDILVVFAGKFEKKKDPELLTKAVQLFNASSHQHIHLLLTGNGPLEDKLKHIVQNDPYIKFLPVQNQQQMPLVYRVGQVFCLPSCGPGETWGLAVNEAMACERPVIVSDRVGCAVDLVEHEKNGWIFQSGNKKELTDILMRISEKPEKLKEMGLYGKEKIKDWNYDNTIEAIKNSLI